MPYTAEQWIKELLTVDGEGDHLRMVVINCREFSAGYDYAILLSVNTPEFRDSFPESWDINLGVFLPHIGFPESVPMDVDHAKELQAQLTSAIDSVEEWWEDRVSAVVDTHLLPDIGERWSALVADAGNSRSRFLTLFRLVPDRALLISARNGMIRKRLETDELRTAFNERAAEFGDVEAAAALIR